jgi:hypothetical protein
LPNLRMRFGRKETICPTYIPVSLAVLNIDTIFSIWSS